MAALAQEAQAEEAVRGHVDAVAPALAQGTHEVLEDGIVLDHEKAQAHRVLRSGEYERQSVMDAGPAAGGLGRQDRGARGQAAGGTRRREGDGRERAAGGRGEQVIVRCHRDREVAAAHERRGRGLKGVGL
ncbi:hypothetical protein [Methylobacterium frigidaeris]|uniref:hypothetical protein n=1 Tax=Methylobacterium frigidaeris TaxID=2038277 RepID=UPI000C17467E|nr:hypothetical protein [Methylobacterium frigidaeris]PIK70011.1 hypothetical protein CS379_26910 [Methylobacterium frigidaeris]